MNLRYRIALKGRDCKDDLKLCKFDDPKVKLSLLLKIKSFYILFCDLAKKNNITVERKHKYEGTDYNRL